MLTRFLARRRAIAFLAPTAPIGDCPYAADRAALLRQWFGDTTARRWLAVHA